MAFGQQAGPPAPANQLRELLTLLQGAGHTDFRDARGPMGFTQRQASGKFTRDEVAAFIDRLQADPADPTDPTAPASPAASPASSSPASRRPARAPTGATSAATGAPPTASNPTAPTPTAPTPTASNPTASLVLERAMRGMPSDQLAAELRRRGWLVLEP